MHRISVLRDDVIFVLYLVQRRIYRLDAERPAEGLEVEAGDAPAEGAEEGAEAEAEVSADGEGLGAQAEEGGEE